MSPQREPALELEIESMAHGGFGVARYRRRAVFVPYTIPGERVQARIVREDARALHAEGIRLLDASADRVLPRCPHFGPGQCWRCQWQHIDYRAQLLLKQDLLAEQLERLGGVTDDVVQPVIASPAQWGYNHHMTFTPLAGGALGLPRADERSLVALDTCLVLHPDLLVLLEQLDLALAGIRRVKLQIGSDGAMMIVLYVENEDAPELETDLKASVNLVLPDNEPVNLIGDTHTRYRVHERDFRVTVGTYYRANAVLVPALVDSVLALLDLQPEDYVLDLYAGAGTFSAFLAQRAQLVTAVESYPPAATDAETNLSDLENVDVIEGSVESVLGELDGHYDVAVVDPAGPLGAEVIAQLVDLGVKRLVYVSGAVGSLARDCKPLARAGYRLMRAQPLDFAPQTYHIDTAALFVRG